MLSVHIRKHQGDLRLDVSFQVDGCAITAVFGPSGAGKTPLINCIAGLLRPDEGRIECGGTPYFDARQGINLSPERRRVGYVFQDGRLFPHMSVRANLLFGRRFRPGPVDGAATLEEAAHRAVALAAGRPADFVGAGPDDPDLRLRAAAAARFLPAERRFLRGLYTGGTFCYEAQVLLQNLLEPLYSNTPFGRAKPLESAWKSRAHTLLDLGDDEFTRGRPHPMIDPAPRNARVVEEAADPETGVILLDVVLGYGSNPDPAGELARAVASARAAAADARVRPPVFVASVCGTEADPQRFSEQCAVLEREDVRLCESNAQAVMLALLILRQAAARPHAVGGPS